MYHVLQDTSPVPVQDVFLCYQPDSGKILCIPSFDQIISDTQYQNNEFHYQ